MELDPRVEYLAPEALAEHRLQALRRQVAWARERSPFYASHLPETVAADVRDLPFVTRAQLAEHQEAMATLPRERWADVSRTSGSTGRPIYVPASLGDLERIRHFVGRSMEGFGIRAGETAALLLPLDELINPPVILEHVLRHRFGCPTLRIGACARDRQLQYLQDLRPSLIVGAPTPFLLLAQTAREAGVDPRSLGVRAAVLMGQPVYGAGWRPLPVTEGLREAWGCEVFSVYGATEWYSGLCECEAHAGHHVQWESLWVEVVDPESGVPVPAGQVGELVFTTLYREAFPLVRYRTGDLTWMEEAECACGRRSPRVMAVVGRTDDLLKIRGATVFPVDLEESVGSVPGVGAWLIEVEPGDVLRIRLAADDFETAASLVRSRVKERTRLTPTVEPALAADLEARWFEGGARKPRKLVDKRRERT